MNKEQLQQICSDLGIKLIVGETFIKEQAGYYENYNQLEADDNQWYYSEMDFEARPVPEKKDRKKFDSQEDSIKYFFLMTLKEFHFNKIHFPNNPIRKIKSLDEIKKFFDYLGINQECYSFDKKIPQSVLASVLDNQIVVSYIDQNRNKQFSTIPFNYDKGIFTMYKLTYSLHLLKALEKKFIENGVLEKEFTDEDIEIFIK
ncbi:hypothetical protein D3H55_16745 [Bacillus salacetis]|uniref:Uncharacterized protein n=1 Tax=Bacillus salacetis TaxID=2315464 RepID=A0A3A1QSN4_9BACI|nr:hypothetical protein [Bacillus salacetis]RIW30386.1 hypothetical protein D3H55_16745 [Bacillus salacetis]